MNSIQNSLPSDLQRNKRRTWWLWVSGIATLLFAGSELAGLWMSGSRQIWTMLPLFVATPLAYLFFRSRKQLTGTVLFLTGMGLQSILNPLVEQGVGIPNSITLLALTCGVSIAVLPRKYIGRILIGALTVAILSVLIDLFGNLGRPMAELNQGRWIFSFVMLALFLIFFAGELASLNIRTKIVIGILTTGGVALAVLVFFALYQAEQLTSALARRLDASVSELAEEQLINRAFVEANNANQSFEDVADEVVDLAQNWASLRSRKNVLNSGTYWDASKKLIKQNGGQYGNPASDISSVFVPVRTEINDSLIADLNVSAYLDFSAPGVLDTNPSLLALYAIDTKGVIRYYPNIELASLLPFDFDATQRPYFSITAPLFNPQRLPRWTIPYVDAAGGGLVVTVAAPVYDQDQFAGIVAADMQLTEITNQINSIKVGDTGYAFMIDDAGRVLSMPQSGYDMFGIRREDLNGQEFFKQTIIGLGTDELQAVTKRMSSGGNGLLIVDNKGVDTYLSFAPIKVNGYSIALVVPTSELQGAIAAARTQTQQQIRSAWQAAAVILIILLIVAILVSLGLGQIIAAPIQHLTQVATQIAAGDLSVQANASSQDEIGTLAYSFNTMTSRLRATLDGLEQMVDARTAELSIANERNEWRAKQFESIARIARTISSTQDLDVLLPQVTTVISQEFGFYHVGIFLLDAAREYAVLSAANSEGGQVMLARGHRLKVGETGLVGYVTGTGEARVALDTGLDAIFFNNPDLPKTRSEIALPLRVGKEIIGALDVQSTESNVFSQEDINILSTLADQVAIAMQNARQFEQTRKALDETEALAKQFSRLGWQQFTTDKNLMGIRHTGARSTMLYQKAGNGAEIENRDPNPVSAKTRGAHLALPIRLRGEVIGSVDVHSPDNRPWDQDELDIVAAILERAAIAMENARLLEESQRLASKEAKIGEVTAKISSSINMRNVLQTAVEELGRALPGSEVVIQFEPNPNKNQSTS